MSRSVFRPGSRRPGLLHGGLLLYYCITILCYCTTLLLFHSVTVLLHSPTIVLLYYCLLQRCLSRGGASLAGARGPPPAAGKKLGLRPESFGFLLMLVSDVGNFPDSSVENTQKHFSRASREILCRFLLREKRNFSISFAVCEKGFFFAKRFVRER